MRRGHPRRRHLLAAAAIGCAANRSARAAAPDLPDRLAARFDALHAAGRLDGLHAAVALQADGRTLLERYLPGGDNAWGRPLGRVAFGPGTLHDLRSVTKSLVGLLYGVALAEERVPPPDAPLLAQFPEYADLAAADPRRAAWTVRHALTMTLGTAWDESLPYTSPANSEIAMEAAPDRLRFVLDRPFAAEPGERWTYNGGATALLGALIARGTGADLPACARARLFDPLGLGPTEWARGRDGAPSAASGARMAPRDLARIGLLVLADGAWAGRPVVPAAWLAEALRPAVALPDGRGYGHQWYLGRVRRREDAPEPADAWVGAIGNGGQRLFVVPAHGLVLATTAGNYNRPDQGRAPLAVLRALLQEAAG